MQKESWVHALAALVLGAFALLLRWLQDITIFDAETGLAASGAAVSWLYTLLLLLSVLALLVLCRRLRSCTAQTEPELALDGAPKGLGALLAAASAVAGLGCVLLYFTGAGMLTKITALLGILSIPALLLFPSLPRWGTLGALLTLFPVVFFGSWLISAYRTYAVNPVVWRYAPLILAIAVLLLSAHHLAAYLFYRAKPVETVFVCSMAPLFCLSVVVDELDLGVRMIAAGWALGLVGLVWLLVRNMSPLLPTEED